MLKAVYSLHNIAEEIEGLAAKARALAEALDESWVPDVVAYIDQIEEAADWLIVDTMRPHNEITRGRDV